MTYSIQMITTFDQRMPTFTLCCYQVLSFLCHCCRYWVSIIRWSPASTVQHASENASRDLLSAVMCTKHSETTEREKKPTHFSLLPCFCLLLFFLFFLRYQRLQSPPLVSGSQTFPVNLDRCKQGTAPEFQFHTCRLALTVSPLRSRHPPIPVIPGMQSANSLS